MIELHEHFEKPRKYSEKSKLSVDVYGIDEYGRPLALCYGYASHEWYEMNGEPLEGVNFKWFYIPKEVKW